jgi:hypothetical protein
MWVSDNALHYQMKKVACTVWLLALGCGGATTSTVRAPAAGEAKQTIAASVPKEGAKDDGSEKAVLTTSDGRGLTEGDLRKVNKENYQRISPGMPQTDVHMILGKPYSSFNNGVGEYWEDWVGHGIQFRLYYQRAGAGWVVEKKEQPSLN